MKPPAGKSCKIELMKKAILISFLLIANYSFSCECSIVKLIDRFQKSEFIAKVKIIKVSEYNAENYYQNAEIEIIDLFKGSKINNIKISNNLRSSCGLYVPENSVWLIFAQIDNNGNLSFGYCSGSKQIDKNMVSKEYPNAEKNRKNSIERKLSVLKFLSSQNTKNTNEYNLILTYSKACENDFKGYEVQKTKFAVYEITIEKDLTISTIEPLQEFDNKQLSEEILKCMKENLKVDNRKISEIDNPTKVGMIYYYYEAGKEYKSFISEFDL